MAPADSFAVPGAFRLLPLAVSLVYRELLEAPFRVQLDLVLLTRHVQAKRTEIEGRPGKIHLGLHRDLIHRRIVVLRIQFVDADEGLEDVAFLDARDHQELAQVLLEEAAPVDHVALAPTAREGLELGPLREAGALWKLDRREQ